MKEKFSDIRYFIREFNCFDINDHGSPKIPGLYVYSAWCEMQDCTTRENKSSVTKTPKVKRENLLHRGAAFALTKTNDGNKARRFPSLPCRAMRHTIYSVKGDQSKRRDFE